MIPYEQLCRALDRHKRKMRGEVVEEPPPIASVDEEMAIDDDAILEDAVLATDPGTMPAEAPQSYEEPAPVQVDELDYTEQPMDEELMAPEGFAEPQEQTETPPMAPVQNEFAEGVVTPPEQQAPPPFMEPAMDIPPQEVAQTGEWTSEPQPEGEFPPQELTPENIQPEEYAQPEEWAEPTPETQSAPPASAPPPPPPAPGEGANKTMFGMPAGPQPVPEQPGGISTQEIDIDSVDVIDEEQKPDQE